MFSYRCEASATNKLSDPFDMETITRGFERWDERAGFSQGVLVFPLILVDYT